MTRKTITISMLVFCMIVLKSNIASAVSNGSYAMPKSLKSKYEKYYELEKESQKKPVANDTSFELKEFVYNSKVDMPIEHQEYLYKMTKLRRLDYLKTLAILKHESQYDQNAIAINDYGYMQINSGNHVYLSRLLKTPMTPLDPYVNINWGTYMLSNHYQQWTKKGIRPESPDESGFTMLDRYTFSSYNKGVSGVLKTGEAISYLSKVKAEYEKLKLLY